MIEAGQPSFLLFVEVTMGSGFNFLLNRVDVTPGSTGWQDIDASPYIPVGASGVICILESSSVGDYVAVRKKTATESRTTNSCVRRYTFDIVGVDGSRVFQGNVENTDTCKIWIAGWADENISLQTNATYLGTPGEGEGPGKYEVEYDVSSYCPAGSKAAILELQNTAGAYRRGWVKAKGCTQDRYDRHRIYDHQHRGAIVKLDADRHFIAYGEAGNIQFYFRGYVKSSAPLTFFTDAIDVSATGTCWAVEKDITAHTSSVCDGAILELLQRTPSGTYNCGMRKKGSSDAIGLRFLVSNSGVWAFVGTDTEQVIDYCMPDGSEAWLLGYAEPGPMRRAGLSSAQAAILVF